MSFKAATRAALGLLLPIWLLLAAPAIGAPVRLRVKPARGTLTVGEKTELRVTLLDEGYRPAPSDRPRTVVLSQRGTGDGKAGSGEIAPRVVTVPAGASSPDTVTFTAKSPGWLTIRAASDGLASGEDLVDIRPARTSFLSAILTPTVFAQAQPPMQLRPRAEDLRQVPANGLSAAQIYLTVSQQLGPGQVLRAQVTTSPQVRIVYGSTPNFGVAEIRIAEGESKSDVIAIQASEPGRVTVKARDLSSGQEDQVEVVFQPPQPTQIVLEDLTADPKPIATRSDTRPLKIWLKDSDGLAIKHLADKHKIALSETTGRPVSFDASLLELSGVQAVRYPDLHWHGFPTGGELHLLAEDRDGDGLASGEMSIPVAMAGYLLAVSAGIGGFLGGMIRHVYRVGTPTIRPARRDGRLEPGLLVDALFSSVFGLALFEAANCGIVAVGSVPGVFADRLFAGFLGVLGGFGGTLVLERLLDKLLPDPKPVGTSAA